MIPLKVLAGSLLFLFLAWCWHMRNNARGVNFQEKSDEETVDDDCPTDEEEYTIQERMAYQMKISDHEIKIISSKIWNSVADLNVQYDGQLDKKGNRILFNHTTDTNNAIDQPFKSLFRFYKKDTGVEDPCVRDKLCDKAQNGFLGHIFNEMGGPIRVLYDSLNGHGIFKDDYSAFKGYLKEMWFTAYSRSNGRILDSSGFEHVFLGEIKNRAVAGLHNWMRMYDEELPTRFALNKEPAYYTSSKSIVANISFTWYGHSKTRGSTFFMKKNPAVEIALYTLCFMVRSYPALCWIDPGPFQMKVKAIALKQNKRLICTAYPEIP